MSWNTEHQGPYLCRGCQIRESVLKVIFAPKPPLVLQDGFESMHVGILIFKNFKNFQELTCVLQIPLVFEKKIYPDYL